LWISEVYVCDKEYIGKVPPPGSQNMLKIDELQPEADALYKSEDE